MEQKLIAQITPWHAKNPDCPFDCVGCEYNSGVSVSGGDIYVYCELDDN